MSALPNEESENLSLSPDSAPPLAPEGYDDAMPANSSTVTDGGAPKTLRGKEANSDPGNVANLGTPATVAAAVAATWGGGVDAILKTGNLVADALAEFRKDNERVDAFIDELVKVGWLTSNEARTGTASPKLLKMNRIGECRSLFSDTKIKDHLPFSYSTVYQLTVLHEALPGGVEEKKAGLIRILESREGEVTREFLSEQTRLLKDKKKDKAKKKDDNEANAGKSANGTSRLSDLSGERKFDQVVINALRLGGFLNDEMAPGFSVEECLPLRDFIEEKALTVILTRVSDIPGVAKHLLAACGFETIKTVMLTCYPSAPDITKANAIVIAQRGGIKPRLPEKWKQIDAEADLPQVACELFPDAKSRLYAFAGGATPGFVSMIGDDSWLKKPSLK